MREEIEVAPEDFEVKKAPSVLVARKIVTCTVIILLYVSNEPNKNIGALVHGLDTKDIGKNLEAALNEMVKNGAEKTKIYAEIYSMESKHPAAKQALKSTSSVLKNKKIRIMRKEQIEAPFSVHFDVSSGDVKLEKW